MSFLQVASTTINYKVNQKTVDYVNNKVSFYLEGTTSDGTDAGGKSIEFDLTAQPTAESLALTDIPSFLIANHAEFSQAKIVT